MAAARTGAETRLTGLTGVAATRGTVGVAVRLSGAGAGTVRAATTGRTTGITTRTPEGVTAMAGVIRVGVVDEVVGVGATECMGARS